MEQTDDNVGILALPYDVDPFACRGRDVFKTESAPQRLGEPHRYAGGEHAYHGDFYTLAFYDGIWFQIRSA